jgi:hypothetical protein
MCQCNNANSVLIFFLKKKLILNDISVITLKGINDIFTTNINKIESDHKPMTTRLTYNNKVKVNI